MNKYYPAFGLTACLLTLILLAACNGNDISEAPPKTTFYRVEFNVAIGGALTPASGSFSAGTRLTITVNVTEGYALDSITGCNGTLEALLYTTAALTQNCTITASFILLPVAPTNLTVTAAEQQLTFYWDTDTTVTDYTLYYDEEPVVDDLGLVNRHSLKNITSLQPPFTLANLTNNQVYFAVITARKGAFESATSQQVFAVVNPLFTSVGGLNDTGLTLCADSRGTISACNADSVVNQDALIGRDAVIGLVKQGSGRAGFDFTKLDEFGAIVAQNAPDWRCVRDNHTGLIWEVKTQDGSIQDQNLNYYWYEPDDTLNGGNPGYESDFSKERNTLYYSGLINELKLCGVADWRLPTPEELTSIVDYSFYEPAIDSNYFPNTLSRPYLTSQAHPLQPVGVRAVNFRFGSIVTIDKISPSLVRLVSGPVLTEENGQ
ncbi:hypothetical protein GCM10010919_17210 [Alishewanella longhuensis]|uniref:Fibronectin type-III domain-containing protein n=1 Tax=Alishewanella longhuensis TaxID=1091037 RepID=A0ABQ3L307_9ALTE|nr:DUF1566 domain-containing protein [Alishewanella longhuensis]GHG68061.1 hypothetical protein GCM10010919_17210 [Alishewanella longhuensis]